MKKTLVSVFALTMVALVSNGAMATVPDLIPIQGVLADDVGAPVDGATDITFALYAAETGGTALWTDPFADVDVVDGFFTVYLGSQTTLDLTAYLTNAEIWLGINVEGDGEMDRIQLATVPFAVQAQVCQAVGGLTESDINTNFAASAHNHDAAYAPITHTHAWSDITSGMPAGFSDGVDNDTTYDAGYGLTLAGTTFSANLTFQCMTTTETVLSVAAGGNGNCSAPACPAGYTATATNCESASWSMPLLFASGGICSARNETAAAVDLRASRVCCTIAEP